MSLTHPPLFGTDGIRGRANFYPMTVENILAVGKALALYLRQKTDAPTVVIGKDTRLSGYIFENALVAGLASMGVTTMMTGPIPTPAIAYLTRSYRADAGLMVSASHNPFWDNGLKIFDHQGMKLDEAHERKLTSFLDMAMEEHLPADAAMGKNVRLADADGRYIEHVKQSFPHGRSLRGMRLIVDCAHGASHRVAPLVFQELGASVCTIGAQPNGCNINAEVGALHPEALQNAVRSATHTTLGIGLDGDGDRLILVDEMGDVVDGSTLWALAAQAHSTMERPIVGTTLLNQGVAQKMQERGWQVIRCSVGDRHVLHTMHEHKAHFGGEPSGHAIFHPHTSCSDGLVAALKVLAWLQEQQIALHTAAQHYRPTPSVSANISIRQRIPLEKLPAVTTLLRHYEAQGCRIILRYSGTEPLCRLYIEGEHPCIDEALGKLKGCLNQLIGDV